MIAKISTSNSPRGALNYNYEKLQEGEAKILQTNKIWKKYSGEEFTANELAYIFEERAAINKNTKKDAFVHISLNPHPEDVLTDDQLTKIADEYMEKLGYGNQPYIIFKHEDIDRHHLHIITTNVDTQGKKIKMSDGTNIDSNDFYRSQKITRELEQKYNLHPAVKQKNENSQTWQPEKVDTKKKITPQIRNIVKHITHTYHFQSFGEYRALLSLYNIDVQEVRGEAAGKQYEGVIYSVMDDAENRVANPVKSSVLGEFAGAKNLGKIYKKSAEKPPSKATIDRIKNDLPLVMHAATSEANLVGLAKEKGIDLRLYKNGDGRTYGVTVVDHKSKSVFKASRLGKEFSANAFHSLLNQGSQGSSKQEQVQATDSTNPAIVGSQDSSTQEQVQERYDTQVEYEPQDVLYAKDFGWIPEQEQTDEHVQRPYIPLLGGMNSLFNAVGGTTKYAPEKKKKKKKKGQDLSI
ncbi:MAG: relaxase/mobilization nuclease domain-containing protein [Prevotellaceae bacterium]|jgi:hypothetical protein|nr:relaxase/mobilization nuclease domain-containing protein [Prevotellaceae bacterium]